MAEAVKLTGLPLRPATTAVTVLLLLPAWVPSVQVVSVATPLALVETTAGLAGLMLPPPAVTVNVTSTPLTGFPPPSLTITDGAALTAVPTVADWDWLELAAIWVAAPALSVMVAELVPDKPDAPKPRVFGPAVPVMVSPENVATPDPLVVAEALASDPDPGARLAFTNTPA